MKRPVPTEEEVREFMRQRQERRMPGYRRIQAERAVELFKAGVQLAKRNKRKKRKANRTASTPPREGQ